MLAISFVATGELTPDIPIGCGADRWRREAVGATTEDESSRCLQAWRITKIFED